MNTGSYVLLERVFWILSKDVITVQQVMDRFEVSKNTVYRDINFIRDRLKVDIKYDRMNLIYYIGNNVCQKKLGETNFLI